MLGGPQTRTKGRVTGCLVKKLLGRVGWNADDPAGIEMPFDIPCFRKDETR